MGALFSKPKTPKAPPPPETIDEGAETADEQRRNRARRGRASTLLVSGGAGPSTAGKTLTGN